MDDPVLKKAGERRAELLRELQELDIYVKVHKKLAATTNTTAAPPAAAGLASLFDDGRISFTGRVISKKAIVEGKAVELLRAHQPMTTADILQAMESQGVDVGGTDKAVNLASYLSKSDLIIHRRKHGGWFLKDDAPDADTESPPATAGAEGS